jgi:hypothetical protein
MAQPTDSPAEAQKLRQALHEKIDQLSPTHLTSLSRAVLEWELKQLRQNLDSEFNNDREAGKLTPSRVIEAIALHRARRPYGR